METYRFVMAMKSIVGAAIIASMPMAVFADDFKCASFPEGDFLTVDITNGVSDDAALMGALEFEGQVAHMACNDGNLYYVSPDGDALAAYKHDNGPDAFVGGLARFIDSGTGLIGYVDENLDVAIAAGFVKASAFNDGVAQVLRPDEDERTGREFIDMHGVSVSAGKERQPIVLRP